jgi:RNA polymerase sigma-70 factor (ECF subfamily)
MIGFEDLYQRYSKDVFRFALYLCADRAKAEDITSETFVRLWTAPEPLRGATVKAYLFAIARNLYPHELRLDARRGQMDDTIPDAAIDPEGSAEQKEALRAVFQGLKQLAEVDRAALLLRAMDEMPYEEIALVLGLPLSTVKVKIHRARIKLAQLLEQPIRRSL